MRALVIGADGFAGRWLVRHLADSGDEVAPVAGPRFTPSPDTGDMHKVDVRDADAIGALVEARAPEAVFNLAGISRQGDREDAGEAVGISVIGSVNLAMACARMSRRPRLVFVSTGYVYRAGPDPLDERSPLEPDTVYAAAKLAAERVLLTIGPAVGVDVVVARPFNHIGPGQSDGFLVPTLARQVADIARSGAGAVRVADPAVVRDFTDVRDVVAAYRTLAERGTPGAVYNIASGRGVSVTELAETMASIAGIDAGLEDTGAAPREHDPRVLVGLASRMESLGWRRDHTLRSTLEDVLRPYVAEAAKVR
jgi:GDP-4-dehydro-6-deoxy-D-mannose reductase